MRIGNNGVAVLLSAEVEEVEEEVEGLEQAAEAERLQHHTQGSRRREAHPEEVEQVAEDTPNLEIPSSNPRIPMTTILPR